MGRDYKKNNFRFKFYANMKQMTRKWSKSDELSGIWPWLVYNFKGILGS